MTELHQSYEELGLCPHGRLPGICADCLKTDEGEAKRQEIAEESTHYGSELAQELERETGIAPYDVTMVLGAGFKEPAKMGHLAKIGRGPSDESKRGWLLNHESRLRLAGAAKLYLEGRTRVICLTGGKGISEQWKDHPSLAELGKNYLVEKYGIPAKDIIIEKESDATHGNLAHGMRELWKAGVPVSSFVVISSEYHVERARRMAEESGIETDVVSTEGQLVSENPHFEKYLENWNKKVYDKKRFDVAEDAKMVDNKYWSDRAMIFRTPLDQDVPPLDITETIKKVNETLKNAGAEISGNSAF